MFLGKKCCCSVLSYCVHLVFWQSKQFHHYDFMIHNVRSVPVVAPGYYYELRGKMLTWVFFFFPSLFYKSNVWQLFMCKYSRIIHSLLTKSLFLFHLFIHTLHLFSKKENFIRAKQNTCCTQGSHHSALIGWILFWLPFCFKKRTNQPKRESEIGLEHLNTNNKLNDVNKYASHCPQTVWLCFSMSLCFNIWYTFKYDDD